MTTEIEVVNAQPVRRKWLPFGSFLSLLALVTFVAVLRTQEAFAAAVLLGLSVCLDYLVLREQRPNSHFSNELAYCEYVKTLFVAIYLAFEAQWLRPSGLVACIFSGAAFVAALAVTSAMVAMAAALMRTRDADGVTRPLTDSLDELRGDKVLALSGLVVAFLHITYFLAFAIAFSDRFDRADLWAVRLADTKPRAALPGDQRLQVLAPAISVSPHCPSADSKKDAKFYFVQSAATLGCTSEILARVDAARPLQQSVCEGGMNRRRAAFERLAVDSCTPAHAGQPDLLGAAAWNVRELYDLRAAFHGFAQGPSGSSYLVEVRGHANDTTLRSGSAAPYASNYEISKQRADQVALLLQSAFRDATRGIDEPSIRWLSYGVSNEDSFLDAAIDPDAPTPDRKLAVEVRVHTVAPPFADGRIRDTQVNVSKMLDTSSVPRKLDLIDYIYFTVYTITTTGYGDIVPISSWAKFLVSIANLIELLFVVVLVNVVANIRPPESGDAAGGEHAARA